MYREEDLNAINAQIKKRWQITGVVCAVLLAAIVYSFIIRIEALTTALTILLFGMLIFVYDLLIRPLKCYAAHLYNALHGRTRQMEGAFLGMDEEISLVDGVRYNAIHVSEKVEDDDELQERLFYFDVQKPFPAIEEGSPIRVTFHDREVADLTVL